MARLRCLVILVALLAGACGAPAEEEAPACVPGHMTECFRLGCVGQGVQVCEPDGSGYGACICEEEQTDGGTNGDGPGGDGPGGDGPGGDGPGGDGPSGDAAGPAVSNLGLEFWPTVTMNSQIMLPDSFSFAVAVAAPATNPGTATITITGGGMTNAISQTVAPGSLQTIKLPWVAALRQTFSSGAQTEKSIQQGDGAYHLTSTQPVAVYQFNALEYQVGADYSYTNDASLLLPQPAWADADGHSTYIVMSRPTMEIKQTAGTALWSPGFFAVVAAQDGTQVTVKFTAHTLAATAGIQAYAPGDTGVFSLSRGTVLMIAASHDDACTGPAGTYGTYCDLANGYDLTGTEIAADKPVAVFGGHNCDFVPFDKYGCDHLEEQLFPVTTWGKHYLGTRVTSTTDPTMWRVVSGAAANLIQFSPPIIDKITNSTIGQVTLDRGKYLEVITDQSFEATGAAAFLLAGFMVGADYSSSGTSAPGDPSMSLAVPVAQFRQAYTFLAPESYQQNYVAIVAQVGSTVTLDGTPLTISAAVGATGWGTRTEAITGGTHTITTGDPAGCGIQVYGVGSYTSYMYPGGLNLDPINQ